MRQPWTIPFAAVSLLAAGLLPAGTYTIVARGPEGIREESIPDVQVAPFAASEQDLYLAEMVAMKPNIYLYPEQTTEVAVELALRPGYRLLASEPDYGAGWRVEAAPDGLIDGRWGFLFYEASVPPGVDTASGWSVPRAELAGFFDAVLVAYGFNATERADFVDYWVEALPPAPHYHVYALRDRAVDAKVGLDVQPPPDSSLRLWLAIHPAEQPLSLPAPAIEPLQREGFTLVEWGVVLF